MTGLILGMLGQTLGNHGHDGRNPGQARDDDNDSESIARLRRQSESLDIQSGRGEDAFATRSQGVDGGDKTSLGDQFRGDGGRQTVGRGDGVDGARTGVFGNDRMDIDVPAGRSFDGGGRAGLVPATVGTVDRLVTALVQSNGADQARGFAQPGQQGEGTGYGTQGLGRTEPTANPGQAVNGADQARIGADNAAQRAITQATQAAQNAGVQNAPAAPQPSGQMTPTVGDPQSAPAAGASAVAGGQDRPGQPQQATAGQIPARDAQAGQAPVRDPANGANSQTIQPGQTPPTIPDAQQPQAPGAAPNPAQPANQSAAGMAVQPAPAAVAPAAQQAPAATSAPAMTPAPATAGQPAMIQMAQAAAPISPTPPATPQSAVHPVDAPAPAAAITPQSAAAAAAAAAVATATGGAPIAAGLGGPVQPIAPVGPRAAGEALVARQTALAAKAERDGGSSAGVKELNLRAREVPSGSAAEVIGRSQALLGRAADQFASGGPTGKIERVAGLLERPTGEASRTAQAWADLAAALDAGALRGGDGHVTKDVARAIASGDHPFADGHIAFGAAVALGAGLALPIALIEAYDERGEGGSARALEQALAAGLARLMKRLIDSVEHLAEATGPLAFEWASWRAGGMAPSEIERRLRARLARDAGLLEEIDDALEAIDRVGCETVNALERLSRWSGRTPEIVSIWRQATGDRKTAFAIAQSVAAQHIVAQALAPGLRTEPTGQPDAFSREAAQELYASLGFEEPVAEQLSEITLARHAAIQMGGGWMRARRPRDRAGEAAFARLVAFLEGNPAPANRYIETITFADLDPDGERPETLVGAPLMCCLELVAKAA